MKINPLTAIDFYKADHRRQYPKGTSEVYANFTARSNSLAKVLSDHDGKVVVFGVQYLIKHFLQEVWDENFFKLQKKKIVNDYKYRMDNALGPDIITVEHIESLHDLGYLPIRIKALPEGARVPMGVPILTIVNTDPDFFWLTNYIESVVSCYLWKPMTSATTAFEFRRLLTNYALKTGSDLDFVRFQANDFSFRSSSSLQDAFMTGAAHLTSFVGTANVPGIDMLECYYNANSAEKRIGFSIPSTEHSVISMGTKDGELETFKRLITEIYPKGIVSIVSDTWDFWRVITEFVNILKDEILNRDGKVVIRPDSGDPIKIVCGDENALKGTPEHKGAIQCLWDIFGGSITKTGYKLLDQHIGLIYGDSISLDRAEAILKKLKSNGFASSNIVFGIGSNAYQSVTRDSFGFAMKTTSGVVNGQRRDVFKDPKTDDGTKKSAKGLLRVEKEGGNYVLYDQQTEEQETQGELEVVFENGKLIKDQTLCEIRDRIDKEIDIMLKKQKY
ncbi:MAG: nicotinamide phosphoribosyltransferase [Candidatus Midichloriaceae bacterium]|jgi:nicotinamide phosphoribosyltransferase